MERRAVAEKNTNLAIGSGFDRVVLIDEILDVGLSNSPARAHDGD